MISCLLKYHQQYVSVIFADLHLNAFPCHTKILLKDYFFPFVLHNLIALFLFFPARFVLYWDLSLWHLSFQRLEGILSPLWTSLAAAARLVCLFIRCISPRYWFLIIGYQMDAWLNTEKKEKTWKNCSAVYLHNDLRSLKVVFCWDEVFFA